LVFQFIKNILAIAAIAIQLAETHKLLVERCGENGIFVDVDACANIDEDKFAGLTVSFEDIAKSPFTRRRQYDHAALPAPPSSRNRLSLACQPCPVFAHSLCVDRRSIMRLTLAVNRQLEEIGQAALFRFGA